MRPKSHTNENAIYTFILIIVALVIFGVSLYIYRQTNVSDISVASLEGDPTELVVSNLSDTSASISWYDASGSNATLFYAEALGTFKEVEPKYQDKKNTIYELINLKPNTTYYYKVKVSEGFYDNGGSNYTFTTYPASDAVTIPTNLLISLPVSFSNGMIFVHASDGNTYSAPASTFSIGNNASIDLSKMSNTSTGDLYNLSNADILIAATSQDGTRYSKQINPSETKITIDDSNTVSVSYNPARAFSPVTTVAEEPTTEPPVTTPTTPTNNNQNNGGSLPPANNPTTQNPLPSTALDKNDFLNIAKVSFGACFLLLGYSIRDKKRVKRFEV